ncbi:unnamed protein product, partial [marine sediment metagenome]
RRKLIKRRFKGLKKREDDIDELSCTDLGDKVKLILKIEDFNEILRNIGLSKSKAKDLFRRLKKLRNNIAHARYIKSGFYNWKEVINLIKKIELLSEKLKTI